MTTDESDTGWDSLAEEFGLQSTPPARPAEKPAAARTPSRPPAVRPERDPRPEVESEADDFGAGMMSEPPSRAAMYDPGPDAVADDADEFEEAAAGPMDDGDEGDEMPTGSEGAPDGEGGKRRRRRRRRKKKGGPETESSEPGTGAEAEDESIVEEGEAPAEVEGGDDDEPVPTSAVDEEMEAESAGPRPEWHVMTWMELVSKLYRPN